MWETSGLGLRREFGKLPQGKEGTEAWPVAIQNTVVQHLLECGQMEPLKATGPGLWG